MRSLKLVWVLLLACALYPTTLRGQAAAGATGTVTGQVTDQTGAMIVGSTVTLTDTATGISRTATTNSVGLYVFTAVRSGTYDLSATMPGFRKSIVAGREVRVGETLNVDLSLQVGSATQTVEIKATPGAALQTLNAAMGTSVGGNMIAQLPSLDRDVSGILLLQPTAVPSFRAQSPITSGAVAGHFSDQTTFLLDGGLNTSDLDGNNGIYVFTSGNSGRVRGVLPTNEESVEEFKVSTNNQTVDFSTSGGAQAMVVTKRGSNAFHGAAYDWFQGQWLNSNDWDNNFHNTPKPKSHFNRFGGSIGGPMLPNTLGGKTYFFFNYEGERFPRSGPFERPVPSDLFRQGIIQVRDATGAPIQYDLRQSSLKAGLKQCGPAANLPCDPRLVGFNPIVNQMWSTYEPEPNDFKFGDRLNTFGYRGNLTFPLSNNNWVGRIDHDFGSKYRWFASYRYYAQSNPDSSQVDIGGLLPGHTKGVPASATSQPLAPRSLVTGLTSTFSPNLVNDFRFSYLRNYWAWQRPGASPPQIPGIPGAIEIGGETNDALIPMNIRTQDARPRLWNGHDWDYRDTLSLLHGKHFFQFGGDWLHQWWHFDRYDSVVGGLTQLVYQVTSGSAIAQSDQFQPPGCTATVTTNCLPSSETNNWYTLLGEGLGFVSTSSIVVTRSGNDLTLNPQGIPVHSYLNDNAYSLYFSDAYHLKPNITLNYGLNWNVQMPPYDTHGAQEVFTDQFRNIITTDSYLANRLDFALKGKVYNPLIGWTPVGLARPHSKYVYDPYYGSFMPRISLAWSPNPSGGFLERLFGHKNTVIRGGYGRFYDRNLGIDLVSTPVLGIGFLQPISCVGASTTGQCKGQAGVDPNTAFRIGVDGNVAPLPNIAQSLSSPAMPGVNTSYAVFTSYLDSAFRPGVSDQIDFSIQRELKGNMILEVGWVGNWAKHLFQGIDINDVPWMTPAGGQTFAQAYYNLALAFFQGGKAGLKTKEIVSQIAASPQAFFETSLAGSPYCSGFANCTAAVASKESSNILTQKVTTLYTHLDPKFTAFGPALPSDNQCQWCYGEPSDGFSNYQALVISLQKRASHGLTFNTNLTYSHALGTIGIPQAYTLNNVNNPWNLYTDYGPQFFDRKVVINWLGVYELPFGSGKRWASNNPVLKRVIGGWSFAPVFTYGSGLPLGVYTGSGQEFGNGFDGNGASAIPTVNTRTLSNSPHFGVTGSGGIGVNSDPKNGGAGANLFADPKSVYDSFVPCLIVNCGRANGAGQLRGQPRWNLDFSINKETQITERVRVQFHSDWFNAINHTQWGDPGVNLQSPTGFGTITGGYGSLALGGFGAAAQYGRVIQLGLRLQF